MSMDIINTTTALPAHLQRFVAANSDLSSGVSLGYPVISYKGKVWHVIQGDNKDLIANDQGEPAASIEVVILKSNPALSKIYYPDGYEEGSTEKPTCYSTDSIAPALDAETPQAKKCTICPHNQWGSKITDNGARGKACADHRRLAVAPSGDLDRAMLLRVPAASLRELVTYAQMLERRGVPYPALVTRIGFDHTVAFPKFTFKAASWLDAAQADAVADLMDSDTVAAITALNAPSVVAEAEAPADDILDNPPEHVAAPTKTRAKAKPVAEAEVAAAIEQPVQAPAKSAATGFGGAAKTKAAPTAEAQETTAAVLANGAMSELDNVLSMFDD